MGNAELARVKTNIYTLHNYIADENNRALCIAARKHKAINVINLLYIYLISSRTAGDMLYVVHLHVICRYATFAQDPSCVQNHWNVEQKCKLYGGT